MIQQRKVLLSSVEVKAGHKSLHLCMEFMTLRRSVLDRVSRDADRYIRLTNYCSGPCMPENAAVDAVE
jgi:beta-lysine 5,6-aminomutase alpha subunit